jgi:hypothetical protein
LSLPFEEDRKAEAIRKGWLYFSVGSLVIFMALVVYIFTRPEALAETTLCPLSGRHGPHSIVIIDTTDEWDWNLGFRIKGELAKVRESIPTGGKISIGIFRGTPEKQPFLFELCNPGSPDDYPIYFWLWQNLDRLREAYLRSFREPVDDLIKRVVDNPSSAPSTDLVGFLSGLSSKIKYEKPEEQRIIHIFSDMRQNTTDFSFYSRPVPAQSRLVTLLRSQVGDRMNGMRIKVYFMPIKGPQEERVVREYWSRALAEVGAELTWISL